VDVNGHDDRRQWHGIARGFYVLNLMQVLFSQRGAFAVLSQASFADGRPIVLFERARPSFVMCTSFGAPLGWFSQMLDIDEKTRRRFPSDPRAHDAGVVEKGMCISVSKSPHTNAPTWDGMEGKNLPNILLVRRC